MTNMPSEIKEAWEILAEINDLLGELIQWAGDDAVVTINKLYDEWQDLCSETASARSVLFYDRCKEILNECDSYCNDIVSKGRGFEETAKDKFLLITQLAGDNKETRLLLEDFLKLWNEVLQPQLVLLLGNATALVSRIMDIMDAAMPPVEI